MLGYSLDKGDETLKMSAKESFGERLRMLRMGRQLTLKQFSAEIGRPPQSINNWEMAGSTPSLDTLWLLADYFDVSMDYLFGRSDDPLRR